LDVLAQMRRDKETGALLFSREHDAELEQKDAYLVTGRLHHVTSTEKEELLGEYLVAHGLITRSDLERALDVATSSGEQLGETLIRLGLSDPVDVFRVIRQQGRDRIAAVCSWKSGTVQLHRGVRAEGIQFRLDMDLTICMMAGVVRRGVDTELSEVHRTLRPGPNFPSQREGFARGSAPSAIQMVPAIANRQVSIETAIIEIRSFSPERSRRQITSREAKAAILVAKHLGWIEISP
jgi:serine/threonine-protein kinase